MSTEHITNSIVGHLQELVSIKQNLGTSISNKGVEVTPTTLFKDYPSLIDSIKQENPKTEQDLVDTRAELDRVKQELAELKALIELVKGDLKLIIRNNGGTVADDMPLEGYPPILDKIIGTLGDLEGKQLLIDTIVAKLPHLEDILTIDTPLKEITKYVMVIGPINFKLVDKFKIDTLTLSSKATPVLTSMQDSIGSQMYIEQINRYRDTFTPINLVIESNHLIDLK